MHQNSHHSLWRYACLCVLAMAGGFLPPPGTSYADTPSLPPGQDTNSSSLNTRAANENPRGALLLHEALALALRQNPSLQAYSWEIRVRDAEALQAGLFPNPELELEVENFGGSGDFSGVDNSETTIALGQRIELGGKRPKRRHVAELEREMAEWDYETARLMVLTDVSKAFTDVLAAQESLELAGEILRISDEFLAAVSRRVRAGASSIVEQTRAEVAAATAGVERAREKTALLQSKTHLAAMWGSEDGDLFERVNGNIFQIAEPPSFESLLAQISRNPRIARWSKEIELRRAVVDLENANRLPDITATGGLRRIEETNDSALIFGVTIPVNLIDRNQGTREAARRNLLKAQHERRAEIISVTSALKIAYQTLESSFEEVTALRDSILPQAKRAYQGTRDGYARGLFRYLDVLEAQSALFELQRQQIESLRVYHKASTEIQSLTGKLFITSEKVSEGNK